MAAHHLNATPDDCTVARIEGSRSKAKAGFLILPPRGMFNNINIDAKKTDSHQLFLDQHFFSVLLLIARF